MGIQDEVTTIGVRLEYERNTPEFYLLAFTGDSELRPFMQDGKILLMTNKKQARMVAELSGHTAAFDQAARGAEVWFSIGRAVTILRGVPVDHWASILNTINFLDDLLIALKVSRPPAYQSQLDQLADYLTFDRDLDQFFASASFDRSQACEALIWCIGTLFTGARILPHILRRNKRP